MPKSKSTKLAAKREAVTYFSHIVGRFDKENGTIRGVSVITEGDAKGHKLNVDSQTLLEIKRCAEDMPNGRLKCKLNHKSGVDAVFGYLSDFRVDGPKLLADLHMLQKHESFEQTWEQLETLPNEIGLSVAFVPPASAKNSGKARCEELLSADLVPEPAANPTGLFEAKVDNEEINMETAATTATATTQNAEGDPTLGDLMNFLKSDLMPRINKIEAFQQAVQAELDAADAAEGEDGEAATAEGDDGNAAGGAKVVSTANGGTDMNNGHNPFAASVGAPTGLSPAMASELGAMREAIISMQREKRDAETEAERVEFERGIEVLNTKTEAIVELAEKLELENATLKKALATGTTPVRNSNAIFFEKGGAAAKAGRFEQLCSEFEAKGKKKSEAVMLARKEDPQAHAEYLQRSGVKMERD